ncbi:MAG: hypothetical protein M1118_01250 [Chloroflexi bacterium]|nr:hypothetical protein [Chloroflexota bacterium]
MSSLATSPSTERESDLQAALREVPFIDHHCHPWFRAWHTLSPEQFRATFSESPFPEFGGEHASTAAPYSRAIRRLARILGCEAVEEAVLRRRSAMSEEEYLRPLFEGTNIRAFIDHVSTCARCRVAR